VDYVEAESVKEIFAWIDADIFMKNARNIWIWMIIYERNARN
jgi:hypothetical protein